MCDPDWSKGLFCYHNTLTFQPQINLTTWIHKLTCDRSNIKWQIWFWELATCSRLMPELKKTGGKVSAVHSALTDVLYIACHFIPQEYWGVARLKPGRYSNPSPAQFTSIGGWGLKSHLEACSQYSRHPTRLKKKVALQGRYHGQTTHLVIHMPLPPGLQHNTRTQTQHTAPSSNPLYIVYIVWMFWKGYISQLLRIGYMKLFRFVFLDG